MGAMELKAKPDIEVADGIEGVDSELVLLDGDAVLPAALWRSERGGGVGAGVGAGVQDQGGEKEGAPYIPSCHELS